MIKINFQKTPLKSVKDHTMVIPVYQQGSKALAPRSVEYMTSLIDKLNKDKVFDGAFRQISHLRFVKVGKSENVVFVGFGKRTELTLLKVREALICAAAHISHHKIPSFTFHLSTIELSKEVEWEKLVQAVTESLIMPLYQFTKFKKDSTKNSGVKSVTIAVDSNEVLKTGKEGIEKAKKYIEACNLVRDLVNTPSNELRTDEYASIAEETGKREGLKVKIFKEAELKKEEFNALLAVNKGSDQSPRLVILEHNGDKKELDTVCLVGKGITFDSGGISLKPAAGMEEMKADMAGSATVLGVMQIIAKMKLPLRVVGLMPITDNMPSGKASVPGDIVKAYSGKTIEILNTDAEGRLILADALAYADKHYKPKLMIDFATLTGACVVALGHAGAGVMGTDQASIDRFKKIAEETGDKIWQLPLWDEYREEFKSDNADIKNIGTTRGGGASQGGTFLREFVSSKTPWIHFDIAGSAYIPKPTYRYSPKGATAACVRLVAEFLAQWGEGE